MATLQTAKQYPPPASRAQNRRATHAALPQPPARPQLVAETFEALPAPATTPATSTGQTARPYHERLSEIEHRQLLLQSVKVYPGWELASIQHRPESDMLIAYLVRNQDKEDPALAVREGRAMQIMMDAMGDLRIKRPRQKKQGFMARLMAWLGSLFGGAEASIPA